MKKQRSTTFTQSKEGAETYALMPPYSKEGIKFLYTQFFDDTTKIIADIGSGTGRLTSQVLKNNIVFGVEPDPLMRETAEKALHHERFFFSIDGTAEKTNLPSQSIDYITIGQSFHRFDTEKFRIEADRILRQKDNVIIIWNRAMYNTPIFKELFKAIKTVYSSYKNRFDCDDEIKGIEIETAANRQSAKDFYYGNSTFKTFPNDLILTKKQFHTLCLSLWIFPLSNGEQTQEILKSKDFNLPLFIELIDNIFQSYEEKQQIILPITTDIHFCI